MAKHVKTWTGIRIKRASFGITCIMFSVSASSLADTTIRYRCAFHAIPFEIMAWPEASSLRVQEWREPEMENLIQAMWILIPA